MNKRFWISGLALLAIFAACTATPTATPESTPGSARLLLDDFSPPNPSWALFDTSDGAAYALHGELFLEDRGSNIAIYTPLVDEAWDNIIVGVRVRQVEGTFNNWMGILCRQQDAANYYLFAVSADGYYLILRVQDGVSTPLAGPTLSEAIEQGRNTNQLEVRCEGSTLSLSVNRTFLISRTDATFTEGGVALFADSVAGSGGTTVAFDHLTLTEP